MSVKVIMAKKRARPIGGGLGEGELPIKGLEETVEVVPLVGPGVRALYHYIWDLLCPPMGDAHGFVTAEFRRGVGCENDLTLLRL